MSADVAPEAPAPQAVTSDDKKKKKKNQKKKARDKRRRTRDAKMKEKKKPKVIAPTGDQIEGIDVPAVTTKRMKKRQQYKEKLERREAEAIAAGIDIVAESIGRRKEGGKTAGGDAGESEGTDKKKGKGKGKGSVKGNGRGEKRKRKRPDIDGLDEEYMKDLERGGSDDDSDYEGAETHLGRRTKKARGLGGRAPGSDRKKGGGKGKEVNKKTKVERKVARRDKKQEKRKGAGKGPPKKKTGKKGKR